MTSEFAAENSKLRRVLSTLERRARLPSRHDINDLKKTAQRRKRDYAAVQDVLEDLTDLGEEDEWMVDFLDMDGNSKHELAEILVDEIHDSPWIFRPTSFEAISVEDLTSSSPCTPLDILDSSAPIERLPQNEEDNLRVTMQTLSLQRNWNLEGGGSNSLDLGLGDFIAKDESGSVLSPPVSKDWTPGIAGYLPIEFKRFPTHETQHEAWLEEWHRNVEIDSIRNQLSVSYASESSQNIDGMKCLADRTLFALRKLLETLVAFKKEKPSFHGLLIPTVFEATNAVHIVRMELSDIEGLYASLLRYTRSLFEFFEEEKAIHAKRILGREGAARTVGLAAGAVGLAAGAVGLAVGAVGFSAALMLPPLLIPFTIAAHVATTVATGAAFRDNVNSTSSLKAKAIEHRQSLVSIMMQFFERLAFQSLLHSELVHYTLEELPLDLKPNILHSAALITQTLCLALQSYSQAHIGAVEFSCLDHSILQVNLLGGGENWMNSALDSQGSITASLQPLTCFGEMVKGPLLIFQDSAESGLNDKRTPRDLIASPEYLADIWGPISFRYDTSAKELDILAIHIGGGVLRPSALTPNKTPSPTPWHWRREGNAWPDRKSIQQPITTLSTPIRIGVLVCNPSCPLSKPEEQEQLRNLARDHLQYIAAFNPHWELTTLQAGGQAFQWVIPQFMAGWSKFPGQTRKQNIVRPGSFSFISELSDSLGVLVCLCTGIVQRVPLRVVIAKCMDSYMNDLFTGMPDWSKLRDSYKMIETFENTETDLSGWLKDLPEKLPELAGNIVKMILDRIQHTGIDHDNVLNVAWPRAERGFDSLKIPCEGENTWVKILADSLDKATFACITPSCLSLRLNTSTTRHKCLGNVPKAWNSKRPYCLATRVCLVPRDQEGASDSVPDNWRLRGSKCWIGPSHLMLVATCIEQNGVLILQVKKKKVPIDTFKRIPKKPRIMENNSQGARDCLVVATMF